MKTIVDLALDLAKRSFPESNFVFIATPFSLKYNNIVTAIRLALSNTKYDGRRIDESKDDVRIDQEIENMISKSKVLIADVTDSNPNVCYELGFARGAGIPVLPSGLFNAHYMR